MILVRELSCANGAFSASLEIDGGQFGPVTISDPFGAEGDERESVLEWYFEDWLKLPMLNSRKAETAARSIAEYGDVLFQQLFAATRTRLAYERWLARAGPRQIEIAGSPAFQALRWEALRDPDRGRALATEASLSRASREAGIDLAEFDREAPTIRVLVVTARPGGAKEVGYRTISRPLIEALGDAGLRVEVDLLRPGTYAALDKRLDGSKDRPYQVVHFDLHGALLSHSEVEAAMRGEGTKPVQLTMRYGREHQIAAFEGKVGFLVFEPDKRPVRPEDPRHDFASATEVGSLLAKHRVPIAILNACQSGKQSGGERETSLGARLLDAGARNVVAMSHSITVSAAAKLMPVLYDALLKPLPLGEALRRARLKLANETGRRAHFNQQIQLQDWVLPVLYQREEAELAPRPMHPDEEEAWLERQARMRAGEPPTATGSFLGRDLDILEIERRLGERNLLLIHGSGGTGKTTLLKHLAAWWERTGWIEGSDYFGYDARAWTLEAILAELAGRVLDEPGRKGFAQLSASAQGQKIVEALRRHEQRRLLILDNLESVTPEAFAIRNELPEARREEIADFLARLAGGATLVLLGSRGPVPWLSAATQGADYPLRGLDAEAASELAARILARAGLAPDISSNAMKQLTQLLSGHPLALEVVLSNLARQNAEEVLAALSENAADPDSEETEHTASILACVEFTHAHLDPDIKHLLECLAPFKAAIYAPMLEQYAGELAKQPELSSLSTEGWKKILNEDRLMERYALNSLTSSKNIGYSKLSKSAIWFINAKYDSLPHEQRASIKRAFLCSMECSCRDILKLIESGHEIDRHLARIRLLTEFDTIRYSVCECIRDGREMHHIFDCAIYHISQDPLIINEFVNFVYGNIQNVNIIESNISFRISIIHVLDYLASYFYITNELDTLQRVCDIMVRVVESIDIFPKYIADGIVLSIRENFSTGANRTSRPQIRRGYANSRDQNPDHDVDLSSYELNSIIRALEDKK